MCQIHYLNTQRQSSSLTKLTSCMVGSCLIIFVSSTTFCLAKLQAGIQFGHYVISYGNRPNDYENVFLCGYWKRFFYVSKVGLTEAFVDLKKKFGEFLKDRKYNRSSPTLLIMIIAFLHKQHSPSPRLFYCHMTKVTVSD